jgi:hypothetical protein
VINCDFNINFDNVLNIQIWFNFCSTNNKYICTWRIPGQINTIFGCDFFSFLLQFLHSLASLGWKYHNYKEITQLNEVTTLVPTCPGSWAGGTTTFSNKKKTDFLIEERLFNQVFNELGLNSSVSFPQFFFRKRLYCFSNGVPESRSSICILNNFCKLNCILNNFPKTAQPAQLGPNYPARFGANIPHSAIFVSILFSTERIN